ncbi:MAG: endonuclease III [Deltaproteobacteria bacterium]|nr:endonuclease III [Deltaproteobacteria bacterium]
MSRARPDIVEIIRRLKSVYTQWDVPIVTRISNRSHDPFRILIATMLSQRTKDAVTGQASERLFRAAATPGKMAEMSIERIQRVIYPVGFYRVKAGRIRVVARTIVERYHGTVPDTIEELVKLPGVGRKTANLVVALGYRRPAICVDTHVHRITNRFGYVKTKTPFETEMALRKSLPRRYWIIYNDLLVALGQAICHPVSPRCSVCPVEIYCLKVGVERSR